MNGRGLVARVAKQDPADPSYALLESHRKQAMPRLSAETEALVGDGVRVEEIVWVLTPDGAAAMLAVDLIAGLESRGAYELARTVATARADLEPGHCVCAYMGPEGQFFEWVRIDPIQSPAATTEPGVDGEAEGAVPSATAGAFDAIAEPVRAALRVLLIEHRFVPPLHAAAIGAEGGMLYLRFVASSETGGLDAERLAEHHDGKGLGMPVNLLFTDARGEVARVLLGSEREVEVSVLR